MASDGHDSVFSKDKLKGQDSLSSDAHLKKFEVSVLMGLYLGSGLLCQCI